MKAILISIKPKWVAKILNGEKTIEVRKSMPKCDLPIDVYIYCTKDNHQLVKPKDYDKYLLFTNGAVKSVNETSLNGKVVAKFTLNKVEKITTQNFTAIKEHEILKQSCLMENELFDYICKHNGEPDNPFFDWHISNLVIFDKPKELSEFGQYGYEWFIPIEKAPQSWQFIEIGE